MTRTDEDETMSDLPSAKWWKIVNDDGCKIMDENGNVLASGFTDICLAADLVRERNKIQVDWLEFNIKEDAEPFVSTAGFWEGYDDGYLKPERFLNEAEADIVNRAFSTLKKFRAAMTKANKIEEF